jgi:potassium uptake TrkH family protein
VKNYNLRKREKSERFSRRISRIPFWITFAAVLVVIYDFGFDKASSILPVLNWIYIFTLVLGLSSLIARYVPLSHKPIPRAWPVDVLLIILFVGSIISFIAGYSDLFNRIHHQWIYSALFLTFLREFSTLQINFKRQFLNPAQLFVLSFLTIILMGTLLLMLPKATYSGIPFIDALFTSTSAVCVTGLIVVDTGTYFTHLGQIIIIILIQVGGIGIMTFTSYFSFFFRGGSSYENQLVLREMTNSEKIAEVYSTLKKIIWITFFIEAVGAILIFSSLDRSVIPSFGGRTFFSFFHAISAFCNAGFSTLYNNLYETGFRYNYPLQLTVAFLIIFGGLGFPIVFNFINYIKHLFVNRLLPFTLKNKVVHIPWVININTRIVIVTTFFLLLGGTISIYFLEYGNTLAEHNGFGKIVTAFFGATTPRTAGFNSVDMTALRYSTVMVLFILMWIGASPASTGGGIKTTTFAIVILNFLSLARGKDRIEVYRREISDSSVRRAFATISLSLLLIGVAVLLISVSDSDLNLVSVAFEVVSAFGTVGLSLGITAALSTFGKFIIVITMFLGRVTMLTLMIALFRKVKHLKYRYPSEEILIN